MSHYKNENYEFYNSTQWKKKRLKIIKRDKYLCQICKRYGKNTEAQVVHHIIEVNDIVSDEGYKLRLTDSNLISLCHKCHNQLHKAEEF